MMFQESKRLRKWQHTLWLVLWLVSGSTFAQDAVNPCEILSESINCTAPGMHGAEIDFKTIKLNGKRKTSPMANVGDALVISTGIRYTKRAKVELTTTFNGGCPPRTDTKRIKPEVNVTYTATLDGNSYSGSGAEFTLTAPLAIGSYPLTVTFTGAAANGCIDNAPITESKTFLLDVIDGAYILNLTAQKTGSGIPVAEGTYLCKGQGQQLDFNVTFSDPLANLPFSANDIVWTVSPPNAGSFTGTSGANGDTVTWTQADDFVSTLEDDLVITVNAPDMQPRSFVLTVFGINSTSGVLAPNSTETFLVENANISPTDADKSIIVAALGGVTDVGTGTATKLRTRTFTGASPFGQLENESFLPAEGDQTNPALQIIKKATFLLSGGNLMVEIQSGPVVGDVNITWEQDRPGGTRKILHREHMTVTTGVPAHTVTLIEKGSNKRKTGGNVGPLYKLYLAPLEVEAIIDPGPPVAGYPKWTITHNVPSYTISPPADGATELDTASWLPGHYLIETKLGNDPAEKSQIEVNVVQADLDVDTNRNGTIADDDDAGEDALTPAAGAIVAVNYDDDDSNGAIDAIDFDAAGTPFGEDFTINAGADKDDIAPLKIPKVGSKSNVQFFLKMDASDAKAIHIFESRNTGASVIMSGGSPWSGWASHGAASGAVAVEITHLVQEQADIELGLEALFFPGGCFSYPSSGDNPCLNSFDGQITIELIVKKGSGNDGISATNLLSSDTVKLQVAPFLFHPNTYLAEEIYFEKWGPPGGTPAAPPPTSSLTGVKAIGAETIESALGPLLSRRYFSTTRSQWFQDHVQIGVSQWPGSSMHVAFRFPYRFQLYSTTYQDDWPQNDFLNPGKGLFRFRNTLIHNTVASMPSDPFPEPGGGEFGGNFEIVPVSTKWPHGRIIHGNNTSKMLHQFFDEQKVFGSSDALQKPFSINTRWLAVGHVDEMVGFAPKPSGSKPYKVVIANTDMAFDLISPGVTDGIDPPPEHGALFSFKDTSKPAATGFTGHGTVSNKFPISSKKFFFDGAPHGKITCIAGVLDGETVTIPTGGATTVTFEFDNDSSVSGGNQQVNIATASNAGDVRDALSTAMFSYFMTNSIEFTAVPEGTDSLFIFAKFRENITLSITHTVTGTGFNVIGMIGGKDAPDGRDFTGKNGHWVRIYDGTGKGQVTKVSGGGDGYFILSSTQSTFRTTSSIIWDINVGTPSLMKKITLDGIDHDNKWFVEPVFGDKYIIAEQTKTWFDKDGREFPALWSVKEILSDTGFSTFNGYVQDILDDAKDTIRDEMGKTSTLGPKYLEKDSDIYDDELAGDSDDDFIAVPTFYFGAMNWTPPTSFSLYSYPEIVPGSSESFNPGLANFQPASPSKFLFPKPFMPKNGSGHDVFEKALENIFGASNLKFADDWYFYHANKGEVHCATATKRTKNPVAWWEVP